MGPNSSWRDRLVKWSGGPIVAKGLVAEFVEIEKTTRYQFREILRGTDLYNIDEYWESRPCRFHAMVVSVTDTMWLERILHPIAKGYQASWIVIDSKEKEMAWLSRFLD